MLFLGIDTGGTYTDAVLFDPAAGSVVASAKALTTKHDLILGLRAAIEAVLRQVPDAEIGLVSLSTTLATNAIVERHGSPICLILIGYDESSLERADLRRAVGSDPVVFVRGGHSPHGEEQAPLDMVAVEAAVRSHADEVAAFAISGFFSVRNPAHEIAARDAVRRIAGRPVSCGHELTWRLDAPRRALTVALNARLIPQLQQLIQAVDRLMRERDIGAPLMVVKGDGSLVGAQFALTRPVETILSGPAASVVGARHLSGRGDVVIADIGGTTTDIALLEDGRPVIDREGAVVGGWRTMVEAIRVYSVGLGGDSEVRRDGAGLIIGPRRLLPLCLLASQHPGILPMLREQIEAERPEAGAGRFALRLRALDTAERTLSTTQAQIWEALRSGPRPLTRLAFGYAATRALERLVERGLVVLSGFTPCDAVHLLGLHQHWNKEASSLGAALWRREDEAGGRSPDADGPALAERVVEAVTRQSAEAVMAMALARESAPQPNDADDLGRYLLNEALAPNPAPNSLLQTKITLRRPLVAIGAPAALYYPAVAIRLNTELIIPPHADVCSAVGALAGGIMQSVVAEITSPQEGVYRVHLPTGTEDFPAVESATEHALARTEELARARALEAGAADTDIRRRQRDKIHRDAAGLEIFLERRIEATAFGRPRPAAG